MTKDSSEDDRVHVYHTDPTIRSVLLRMYHELLLAVEDELELPNEIRRLDVVYAPSLTTPTLSKWGLIYVGEAIAPIENSELYSVELKEIRRAVSRSVYEMFFTSYMSPVWWRHRWVQQGLASYFSAMSLLTVDFLIDSVQKVIGEDRNTFTGLQESISGTNDINNPNLLIVQHKAGALMRMIAKVMGKANFSKAVLAFLQANKRSVAAVASQDFLSHLDLYCPEDALPDGMTLSSVIRGYETEGFQETLSTVYVESGDDFLTLKREPENYPVDIRIDFTTPTQSQAYNPMAWIRPKENINEVKVKRADPWTRINPLQFGLYRVSYDAALWQELTDQLMSDHNQFTNRAQLIADSTTLTLDSIKSFAQHFELLRYLKKETETYNWRVARKSYDAVTRHLRGITETDRLLQFYAGLAEDEYLRNRISLNFVNFEMTMQVGWIACLSEHADCVSDVEDYVKETLEAGNAIKGPEEFQFLLYCTLARYSNTKGSWIDSLFLGLVKDPSSKVALRGLTCSEDEDAIKK